MSFYVPRRSRRLSGRSRDAPRTLRDNDLVCLSMSRDALGASRRLSGRSRDTPRTLRDNVFLCLSMASYVFQCLCVSFYVFHVPGHSRGLPEPPGTLSGRSQDASGECLSMSFYVSLCFSMSRDAFGASRRLPGRSRDAPRTLRDYVFLCLYMPGTLSQPP